MASSRAFEMSPRTTNESLFLEAFKHGQIMHEMGDLGMQLVYEISDIPEDYEVGNKWDTKIPIVY
jgi:hypothetical protein